MTNRKPLLTVVESGCTERSQRIAVSFVIHERKRLDIPVGGLMRVEALAGKVFSTEQGPVHTNSPCVSFILAPKSQAQLHEFTADVVGQMMEIHVGKRCVSRAVVQERLGGEPSFQVSAYDIVEAQELAETIRFGWSPKEIK
jgi:preprotein translocase subunit SecD